MTENANKDGGKGNPCSPIIEAEADAATMEISVEVLQKLKIKYSSSIPHAPATMILIIKQASINYPGDGCSSLFIAALFIITMKWKQPRWPATEEGTVKRWWIYVVGYYVSLIHSSEPTRPY